MPNCAAGAAAADDGAQAAPAKRHLVAVTSCPTGIAHTYMAAEALEAAAAKERRGEEAPSLRNSAGGLAVLNVLVASLWHLF